MGPVWIVTVAISGLCHRVGKKNGEIESLILHQRLKMWPMTLRGIRTEASPDGTGLGLAMSPSR